MTNAAIPKSTQVDPLPGVLVQVQLPASVSPALARSVQQSPQKAVALLAERSSGFVDAADRMAELVVGIAEPNSQLLADRIHRMETVRQVFSEGEWLTAEEINRLQANPPGSKAMPASDWKRRGHIFSVPYKGKEYFARYQFDALCQPLPVIREVLEAFGEVADPWILAAWFNYPNGWLAIAKGEPAPPASPRAALDRRDAVIAAAARRHGTFVV